LRAFGRLMATAVALLLCAAGCGYRLVSSEPAGALRGLWVGPVEDEGSQPLLGSFLRRSLAREAVDRPGERLSSKDRARALLTARVLSITESAVAFVAGDAPQEYRLSAEVEAKLERPDGRVLWKGLRIRADRGFLSGTTVEETQRNKEVALERLAGDLSREILRRVSLALEGGARA
jgi:outer membrane lipopolysaccharide assembly protein LptE/RlpB